MAAINLVARAEWGARDRKAEAHLRVPPAGVKVHYVGDWVDPAIVGNHGLCLAKLRAIQADHMDNRHWVDIGYTCAVCPHQEVMVCRGPGILPAANGDGLNSGHYAVLALLGDTGLTIAPPLMLHGLVDAIEWLREQGAGREVKRHCDGYTTTCPGAFLSTWVQAGARRPSARPWRPPAPVPWPGRVLEYPPLMTGEDVATWQAQMRRRGWAITVDGAYGAQSREVCKAFQREKGQKGTGRVDRRTWELSYTAAIT